MNNPGTRFKHKSIAAIENIELQTALDNNAQRRRVGREAAFLTLDEDLDSLRNQARRIRQEVIHNLDRYLEIFTKKVSANGFIVHHAEDEDAAKAIILDILRSNDASLIAKSKSMVSEEIHLNPFLENFGYKVIETDLGEFIVQLRNEPPSHILTPAVHLRRQDVAKVFNEKFEMPITDDVRIMNDVARKELRQIFLDADVGITGVNFGVSETGTICLVTNEGNGRMVSTLPRIHIALMGIERMVPSLIDLSTMMKLLPRSATGQQITSYFTLINSPRLPGDQDGPQERHLILLNNRRRTVAKSNLQETLLCIRCGACLNVCPVYQEVGGHTYESPYPGPIGAIVSPALLGIENYGHLSKASSLCGACMDVCPVKINFPDLLLRTRSIYSKSVPQPATYNIGFSMFSRVGSNNKFFQIGQKGLRILGSLPRQIDNWYPYLPPPFNRWTKTRHFPVPAEKSFRDTWKQLRQTKPSKRENNSGSFISNPMIETPSIPIGNEPGNLVEEFIKSAQKINADVYFCDTRELPNQIINILKNNNTQTILVDDELLIKAIPQLSSVLKDNQITSLKTRLMLENPNRKEDIIRLSQADVGISYAISGIANTGTVILTAGQNSSQIGSLLPQTNIIILESEKLFSSMDTWIESIGSRPIGEFQTINLVSGPSRTADIEMTLTIGVHGPKHLIILLTHSMEQN